MKSFRPLDFVIVFSVLVLGVFLIFNVGSKTGNIVTVTANETYYEYDGSKNGIYSVEGLLGQTFFEIKDGKVRIIDSPCPNKVCIEQGWSSPLVCLPNKVIITVENTEEFDAISE